MSLRIPSSSTEHVKVPVTVEENGVEVDPTDMVVEVALTTTGEPVEADWHVATWETAATEYLAKLLVGPTSDVVLEEDGYAIWVRVTNPPEKVVRRSGRLVIT